MRVRCLDVWMDLKRVGEERDSRSTVHVDVEICDCVFMHGF